MRRMKLQIANDMASQALVISAAIAGGQAKAMLERRIAELVEQ